MLFKTWRRGKKDFFFLFLGLIPGDGNQPINAMYRWRRIKTDTMPHLKFFFNTQKMAEEETPLYGIDKGICNSVYIVSS